MFVVNFDFSEHLILSKLLLINIPVLITQAVAYPLQRLQTLLMVKPIFYTKNQFQESQLILREMIGIEGFPKFYHGLRYSLDSGMTQMTTKFIMFDFLMGQQTGQISKFWVYFNCMLASGLGTVASQSAFNYQVIASSLPIDKTNRDERVKDKLVQYTKKKTVPLVGLKYTLPISLVNTAVELLIINGMMSVYEKTSLSLGYRWEQFITLQGMLVATVLPVHYVYQRQVEVNLELKSRLAFTKGLFGTFIRHHTKGIMLYSLYFWYSESQIKKEFEVNQLKRRNHQRVLTTRS